VLDEVAREWAGGGYGRIVLAASPRLLGHLRDRMPADLRAHVLADLDKDLVKVPLNDLPAHLEPVLAV
jgi:protein required for attachment to host cells